ncbi:hypothetical protein PMIN01_09169 [Paraphaeosphaeria minitans]|uniref:Secreted protein n=1 Tax=Paraphaeosphaeria minitans TaxID=565426 RepID=A0A9P6KN26_9PLEO|nr:hypothetical protein PMIN01_09169 [Paraphaeosphaeria minitans]
MKCYVAVPVIATLLLSVQATPAVVPQLYERQSKAPVSCTANGGAAAGCSIKALTRYGCPHTDTGRCAPVGTTPCGSTVQIYCYVFGETVNGNSMWYNLYPRTNGLMPAAFFSCTSNISN